ncbi:MAG TPA: hypothetical protein VKP30_19250, partial [Polyangiaceae bacterium]|nr:hypothetical protein [Polyangiaceae bacterium]
RDRNRSEAMMNDLQAKASDPKAVTIFAKTIYRELRQSGYSGQDVVQLAGELLSLLSRDVRNETARPAT